MCPNVRGCQPPVVAVPEYSTVDNGDVLEQGCDLDPLVRKLFRRVESNFPSFVSLRDAVIVSIGLKKKRVGQVYRRPRTNVDGRKCSAI